MDNESSFWTFSLAFYADPAIGGICIDLQDRYSCDVNVILFVLWCAFRNRSLSAHEVERVVAMVAPWQNDVVRPLRGVRRDLKQLAADLAVAPVSAFREAIKKQELQAERLQQSLMQAKFSDIGAPASDRDAAARSNVERYATFVGQVFPVAHIDALVARLASIRHE
jgi:uncharacterized protein (TIGR02444 family)